MEIKNLEIPISKNKYIEYELLVQRYQRIQRQTQDANAWVENHVISKYRDGLHTHHFIWKISNLVFI